MRSKEYENYINSFDWYLKRKAAITKAEGKCQQCGKTGKLEVHHLTYERLGHECPDDLMVVCKPCHVQEDKKRALNTSIRQYDARLDGWASKKYGENWGEYKDPEEIEEEFDRWLERREEEDAYL